METLGDMNRLTEEQQLALRSVIAAFKSYDAEHLQQAASDEKPKFVLTSLELEGIYPSEPGLDIYSSTRDDLIQAAPRSRRHAK